MESNEHDDEKTDPNPRPPLRVVRPWKNPHGKPTPEEIDEGLRRVEEALGIPEERRVKR